MSPTCRLAELLKRYVPSAWSVLESSYSRVDHLLILEPVNLIVFPPALDIVHCLLSECHDQDKSKWRNIGEQETHFENWDELGKRDHQKEQVIEELKLVEEHLRHDCYWVVLRVAHLVAHELAGLRVPVQTHFASLNRLGSQSLPPEKLRIHTSGACCSRLAVFWTVAEKWEWSDLPIYRRASLRRSKCGRCPRLTCYQPKCHLCYVSHLVMVFKSASCSWGLSAYRILHQSGSR